MVTQAYIDEEQSHERKPVELFHFWTDTGSQDWYYTSGDVSVVYNTNTYLPAPIKTSARAMDIRLNESKLTITVERILDSIKDFLTQIIPTVVWVEVFKLHRDQSPLEASVYFIGQVRRPTFDGVDASIECVGFEKFLQMMIPTWRYQPGCNLQVFSDRCGLNKADYKETATLSSLSSNGLTLTSTDFSAFADGYFSLGYVVFGDHKRVVTEHEGSTVNIQFAIYGLTGTDSVDIYPGCDRLMTTCRDKYNNLGGTLDRFFGHPYIPIDNPATWA